MEDNVESLGEPEKKVKKPRSEKQIEAFKKAQAKRDENRAKQKEESKKVLEEKVVQKAMSIKKKQIKKMKVLEDISDDETPIEQIRQIQRSITPVKPQVALLKQPIQAQQKIQQPIIKKPEFYFL